MIRKKDYTYIMTEKIPGGSSGNCTIDKHILRKGALIRCYSPAGCFYYDHTNAKLPVVRLDDGSDILMSDTPMEQEGLKIPLVVARGNVLIIGLGIGLYPTLLREHNRLVKSITNVEQSPDVAKLVYRHIKNSKTKLIISEGKEYLLSCKERYDFIFIDIWPGLMGPIRDIEEWTEVAKYCLAPSGSVRCWLQELYDRIKHQLPKEPVADSDATLTMEPCLICAKSPRYDYAGLCMDCADLLGVSEMFAGDTS